MTSKPLHQRLFLSLCLWLQRPGARPTWVYERNVFLLVELVCVAATIAAAPHHGARVALLLSVPFTMYAAELARAARSGDVRRREQEEALGNAPTRLACAVVLATGLARAAMVNGYGAWCRAYRKVVPVFFNLSNRGEP